MVPKWSLFFFKIYKLILFQTQGSILQKSFVENSEDKTEALIVDKKKEKIQRSTIRSSMFILITGCSNVVLRAHYT